MPVIHQDTYSQFTPVFLAALTSKGWMMSEKKELYGYILEFLHEAGYPEQDITELEPYIHLFLDEEQNGQIVAFPPDLSKLEIKLTHYPKLRTNTDDELFEFVNDLDSTERALIEQLIAATNLYDNTEAVQQLLAFTTKLRAFAPFNAMLLHIQKPGLTHAATAHDWWNRFGRVPKKGTRPLFVLRTMGPVDFVFDIQDTEGAPVPEDAFSFPTFGDLSKKRLGDFLNSVARERIDILELDAGDGRAGWIRLVEKSKAKKGKHRYQLAYNKNHPPATCFVTIAHELGHLFLGHLGDDPGRRVPDQSKVPRALREVEAEMVAYLVAMRNGLKPKSESYLSNYKGALKDLNLYGVMRAANAVETALGISAHHLWDQKNYPAL